MNLTTDTSGVTQVTSVNEVTEQPSMIQAVGDKLHNLKEGIVQAGSQAAEGFRQGYNADNLPVHTPQNVAYQNVPSESGQSHVGGTLHNLKEGIAQAGSQAAEGFKQGYTAGFQESAPAHTGQNVPGEAVKAQMGSGRVEYLQTDKGPVPLNPAAGTGTYGVMHPKYPNTTPNVDTSSQRWTEQ
eukprot:TRINITY_DN17051_c0_g1_i1.p1 TRINITY_DN17051_c0_g1~~TRINITY_DN17051_c0_g1_i1.p1  ORF type:complete len:201 (+),score=33.57 TRINITY_DN17051_c0_g1_i1:52-603(+)